MGDTQKFVTGPTETDLSKMNLHELWGVIDLYDGMAMAAMGVGHCPRFDGVVFIDRLSLRLWQDCLTVLDAAVDVLQNKKFPDPDDDDLRERILFRELAFTARFSELSKRAENASRLYDGPEPKEDEEDEESPRHRAA